MNDDRALKNRPLLNPVVESRYCGLSVQECQSVSEEEIWLGRRRSERTRRAYRSDVDDFTATLGIKTREELRKTNPAAVLAWLAAMEKREESPRTIRRRLAALSSLFKHLVAAQVVRVNPVREIERPPVDRAHGTTLAFSSKEARRILDTPDSSSLGGLRDRAILSVGFQVGLRRSEIASLCVRDFHTNSGYRSLRYFRKGNLALSVSINPQAVQRIEAYLSLAGHAGDDDGPLFRPIRGNQHQSDPCRHLASLEIDRILRKHARAAGLGRGYSAHSMRATFITTALANGANLEDVQRDVGHAEPSTTKLYDRRGHDPARSASFFAIY
jgi:integrase/recombinase XerD